MALCFDLMEMVGKQVDVERHKLAVERHKATFNKVLNQLKENGGWVAEAEWNYNDSHWEDVLPPLLKDFQKKRAGIWLNTKRTDIL